MEDKWLHTFPRAVAQSEMESVSSRSQTQVADFISDEKNHFEFRVFLFLDWLYYQE